MEEIRIFDFKLYKDAAEMTREQLTALADYDLKNVLFKIKSIYEEEGIKCPNSDPESEEYKEYVNECLLYALGIQAKIENRPEVYEKAMSMTKEEIDTLEESQEKNDLYRVRHIIDALNIKPSNKVYEQLETTDVLTDNFDLYQEVLNDREVNIDEVNYEDVLEIVTESDSLTPSQIKLKSYVESKIGKCPVSEEDNTIELDDYTSKTFFIVLGLIDRNKGENNKAIYKNYLLNDDYTGLSTSEIKKIEEVKNKIKEYSIENTLTVAKPIITTELSEYKDLYNQIYNDKDADSIKMANIDDFLEAMATSENLSDIQQAVRIYLVNTIGTIEPTEEDNYKKLEEYTKKLIIIFTAIQDRSSKTNMFDKYAENITNEDLSKLNKATAQKVEEFKKLMDYAAVDFKVVKKEEVKKGKTAFEMATEKDYGKCYSYSTWVDLCRRKLSDLMLLSDENKYKKDLVSIKEELLSISKEPLNDSEYKEYAEKLIKEYIDKKRNAEILAIKPIVKVIKVANKQDEEIIDDDLESAFDEPDEIEEPKEDNESKETPSTTSTEEVAEEQEKEEPEELEQPKKKVDKSKFIKSKNRTDLLEKAKKNLPTLSTALIGGAIGGLITLTCGVGGLIAVGTTAVVAKGAEMIIRKARKKQEEKIAAEQSKEISTENISEEQSEEPVKVTKEEPVDDSFEIKLDEPDAKEEICVEELEQPTEVTGVVKPTDKIVEKVKQVKNNKKNIKNIAWGLFKKAASKVKNTANDIKEQVKQSVYDDYDKYEDVENEGIQR